MKRILTICPTIRSQDFNKMAETFYKTSEEENILYEVSLGTVTEAINFVYKKYPDFDFYHITNDDVEYQTKGWDSKFLQMVEDYGYGIFYGNDLIQGENLCTFPFISGEIVRAIGWLQLPTLNRYCGDVVWKFLGQYADCLYYNPNILIKHLWDGKIDESINKKDMEEFSKWLRIAYKDINKIKDINNDESKS